MKYISILLFVNLFVMQAVVADVPDSAAIYTNYLTGIDADDSEALNQMLERVNRWGATLPADQQAALYRDCGMVMYQKLELTLSEDFFVRSADLYKSVNDLARYAKTTCNLSVVQEQSGKYQQALNNYQKALPVFQQMAMSGAIAQVYSNMGVLYQELKQNKVALSYAFKSLRLRTEVGDTLGQATSLNNIGVVYEESLHRPDSAQYYYTKALQLYQLLHHEEREAITLSNIAALLVAPEINKPAEAEAMLQQAIRIFYRLEKADGKANALRNLGSVYMAQGNYDRAIDSLARAERIFMQLNQPKNLIKVLTIKSEVLEKQGRYKEAIAVNRQYTALNDSVQGADLQRYIAEAEIRFDSRQKQHSIEMLNKELIINQAKLSRRNWIMVAGMLLSVGLLMAVVMVFRNRRLRSERSKVLAEQKLLRSQMTPHFIFNTLTSIQNYMFENDAKRAVFYLGSFSALIRSVLKISREEFISVEEEAEYLKSYLDIQQMRKNNSFDYSIQIDDDIDAEMTLIPPMLIQPLVENSIKHGFNSIDYKGNIAISIQRNDQQLQVAVADNGVGINKGVTKTGHKSYATDIFGERIANLQSMYGIKCHYETETNHNDTGTVIRFSVPYREDV